MKFLRILLLVVFSCGFAVEKQFQYIFLEKNYHNFCLTLPKVVDTQKLYVVTYKKGKKKAMLYGCNRAGDQKVDAIIVPSANSVIFDLKVTVEGPHTPEEAEKIANELGSTIIEKLQ